MYLSALGPDIDLVSSTIPISNGNIDRIAHFVLKNPTDKRTNDRNRSIEMLTQLIFTRIKLDSSISDIFVSRSMLFNDQNPSNYNI